MFFLILLLGLGIINYPFVSQWINRKSESSVIYQYSDTVAELDDEYVSRLLEDASAYNKALAAQQAVLPDGFQADVQGDAEYDELLNPGGDGVMGWISIPSIDVMLAVYHGTGSAVLDKGVGHLYQSSLPIGGENTHAVLSAHSGLSTKLLFTDIDQLEPGDCIYIDILNRQLVYQVTDTETVLPEDTSSLMIVPEKDLLTLVTCTPYGINSHRLLVHAERVKAGTQTDVSDEETEKISTGYGELGKKVMIISAILAVVSGVVLLGRKAK